MSRDPSSIPTRDRPRSTVCAGPGTRRAGRTPTAVARGPTSTRSATSSRTSTGSRASPIPTSSTRGVWPSGPATPAWVSDNGTDVSTLYSGGVRKSIPMTLPLVVGIPGGAPTGTVFNRTSGFKVNGAPAHFIFDSEAGTITAWNSGTRRETVATTPGADLQGPGHRQQGQRDDALRRELPRGQDRRLQRRRSRRSTVPGGFVDPNLPAGLRAVQRPGDRRAPGRRLRRAGPQTAADEVAGPGLGYVDVFDTQRPPAAAADLPGRPERARGAWRSPRGTSGRSAGTCSWATSATARSTPTTRGPAHSDGTLTNKDGNPIKINGLWALRFGNGVIGTPQTLLFTAGIGDEDHGLFGEIVVRGSGE